MIKEVNKLLLVFRRNKKMLMTRPKKGLKIAEGLRSSGQEKRTCQIATLVGVKGLLTFRMQWYRFVNND